MKNLSFLCAIIILFLGTKIFSHEGHGDKFGHPKYKTIKVKDGLNINVKVSLKCDVVPEPEKYKITNEEHKKIFGEEKEIETLIVNKENKGIKNVLVRIEKIKEGKDFTDEQKNPVLIQKDGLFRPHILLVAQKATVTVKNEDDTLHYVHILGKKFGEVNDSQTKGVDLKYDFDFDEICSVSCGPHGWMSAYIVVMPHPYFAVTDENGSAVLDKVPAGDYKLVLWHEKLGTLEKDVKVEKGKNVDLSFEFEMKKDKK